MLDGLDVVGDESTVDTETTSIERQPLLKPGQVPMVGYAEMGYAAFSMDKTI